MVRQIDDSKPEFKRGTREVDDPGKPGEKRTLQEFEFVLPVDASYAISRLTEENTNDPNADFRPKLRLMLTAAQAADLEAQIKAALGR